MLSVFNKLITKQQHTKQIKIKKIDKMLWQVPLLLFIAYGNIFRIANLSNFFNSFFSITESFSITKNSAISSWLKKTHLHTILLLYLLILFLKSDLLLSQIYYKKRKQLAKIFSITQYLPILIGNKNVFNTQIQFNVNCFPVDKSQLQY